MNKRLLGILFLFIGLLSFISSEIQPLIYPDYFPTPHYDFIKNPLTKNKIKLGQALFYDPLLSADNSISCASCHSPYNAFAHTDHDLSHGINDQIGHRNAPALFNLAWHKSFMWDGAINHLDMQALAPIANEKEMGSSLDSVISKLSNSTLYKNLFYQAYQDSLATGEHLLKALSAFQLTLVSANSKYDRVKKEEATFSEQEKGGYKLFKIHCASCHAEPIFTTGGFSNNGLTIDSSLNDVGRQKITLDEIDAYQFKIPTLRNIEYTHPYMHDGRYERLSDVIKHYVSDQKELAHIGNRLKKKIELNSNEQVDLIAFLLTLSDKAFVFNPKHQYPKEILLSNKY